MQKKAHVYSRVIQNGSGGIFLARLLTDSQGGQVKDSQTPGADAPFEIPQD